MIGRDRVADWLLAALLRQLVLIFVGENEVCRARLIAGGGRSRFTLGAQTMGVIVGIVSLGHGPTPEALQKAKRSNRLESRSEKQRMLARGTRGAAICRVRGTFCA